ncbi:hypothetical protein V8G54_001962 [Vigna mungo]|uniref:Uncharacterized protein n=1 Tax=Vigna mungo TaxID=3915 RepID=A0AAQ3SBE8_VIGMU
MQRLSSSLLSFPVQTLFSQGGETLFPFSLLVRSRKEGGNFATRVFDFGILGFFSSLHMGGLKLGFLCLQIVLAIWGLGFANFGFFLLFRNWIGIAFLLCCANLFFSFLCCAKEMTTCEELHVFWFIMKIVIFGCCCGGTILGLMILMMNAEHRCFHG